MHAEYILKLYVLGSSPSSMAALENLQALIAQESTTKFHLEVIDVREHPQLAEDDKILAVPTLIRKLPPPLRKIIGDLSAKDRVLIGLDLIALKKELNSP